MGKVREVQCKAPGGVYFLGFVGAAVYYWRQATTFWMIVLGLCKAVFWPTFIAYQVLQFLHM